MNNPTRVTPPLMSDEVEQAEQTQRNVQPTLSEQPVQTRRVESHVEMEPIQKRVVSESEKAQTSASNNDSQSKIKKSATAFRTISEVADELDVQQHVLRFWETKFTQVKPLKRGGGRRYYRPEDVALLKRIHHLLYTEGYTIKGVQKLLKGRGKGQIVAGEANNGNEVQQSIAPAPQPKVQQVSAAAQVQPAGMSAKQRAVLEMMLAELKALRGMVKA